MEVDPAGGVVEDLEDELRREGGSVWCGGREAGEESEVGVVGCP